MSRPSSVHRVAVLALDDVVVGDLGVAAEVLGRTRLANGRTPYDVRVVAERATVRAGAVDLRVRDHLDQLRQAQTVVVPGRADPTAATPPAVLRALHGAADQGARIASICVGAFVLAEAGLLDGLRATTHWAAAGELARLHPRIDVDPNVLYVDNGQILTSAGAAAGFDLLLHVVQRDHGSAVAADTARSVVMPLTRKGGQAQFIAPRPPRRDPDNLAPLLDWIETHHHRPLTLADIAHQASMSARSLNRRFRELTGTTPMSWLRNTRIRHAQVLLETTNENVDAISGLVGFGSPTTFRDHFRTVVGTTPRHYRQTFRSGHQHG
jgi:transcriptional regulator GlxA family with amidase domain